MKILITGSHGFIGSHMKKFLVEQGFNVVDSKGDLRDQSVVDKNVEKVGCVYHFAADMGGIGYFNKNTISALNNYTIDLNIINACRKFHVNKLFYPSSACAYPMYRMNEGVPLKEEMLDEKADPDQLYGWEKLSITKLLKDSPFGRVGILHTIYGAGQAYEGIKAKFPPQIAYKMIQAIKSNKIEVWGNGKQTRTFLHINDAIQKIYEVMNTDEYHGEVNIGSSIDYSVDQIVTICSNILNVNPKVKHDLTKPVGPTERKCDNTKFNQYYKYRDKMGIIAGFTDIINYIKKQKI